jgi:hypothetical protein
LFDLLLYCFCIVFVVVLFVYSNTQNRYCPEDNEIKMINTFLATQKDLPEDQRQPIGVIEEFALTIHQVPMVEKRLQGWRYKMEFDAKINDVKPDIESVLSACKELRASQKFINILRIVLELGNFLNGNSFREGAWGFKLDTLALMVDTKSGARKNYTLMHYFSEMLEKSFPQLVGFWKVLGIVLLFCLFEVFVLSFVLLFCVFEIFFCLNLIMIHRSWAVSERQPKCLYRQHKQKSTH